MKLSVLFFRPALWLSLSCGLAVAACGGSTHKKTMGADGSQNLDGFSLPDGLRPPDAQSPTDGALPEGGTGSDGRLGADVAAGGDGAVGRDALPGLDGPGDVGAPGDIAENPAPKDAGSETGTGGASGSGGAVGSGGAGGSGGGGSGTGGAVGTGGTGTGGTGTGGTGTGGAVGTGGTGTGGAGGAVGTGGTGGSVVVVMDGGADASADGAASDAPGPVICAAENSACTTGGKAGLCRSGICSVCTDGTDDATCGTSYGGGFLCLGGTCQAGNCRSDVTCAPGQICKANSCTACADVTDDLRCGTGKICVGGTCIAGSCRTSQDCSAGQLCASNQCQACSDPSDDGLCAARYGAGFICNGGTCAAGCRSQSACSGGQICVNNVCSACSVGDSATCIARYGTTSTCDNGVCTDGSCSSDTGCGGDTLCANAACSACTDTVDDARCQSRYGSNRLCVGGACIVAACHDNATCGSGQLCRNNSCTACTDVTDDAACGGGKLCIGGSCVTATCRSSSSCSGGTLCGGNQCTACTDVTDDGACTGRYGAGFICNGGTCAVGCRSPADCSNGALCQNNVCSACAGSADDAACVNRYGTSSVCSAGVCSQGTCADDTSCGGATVCQSNACAACVDQTDDARCAVRYGAGRLCVGGACVPADCRADATCTSGKLCRGNNCAACTDMTDDAACASRYGAGMVCNGGTCTTGCRADGACSTGTLCQPSLVCGACVDMTDDSACAARYGAGSICNGGACVAGCRTDNACTAGQLCKNNSCTSCLEPGDDGLCAARYGADQICDTGTCQVGCRSAAGCTGAEADKLCSGKRCTACTADAAGDTSCTTAYGQRVCLAGVCHPGNCRTSVDCTGPNAGQTCVNNQCTVCSNNADCTGDPSYGASYLCSVVAGPAQGTCVSSSCTTANATCPANPSVNFCCAGGGGNTCITGNCCTSAQCGFGQVCNSNQCTQCATVTDGNYYVDPVNGNNAAGVTGSSTCPWKTITYALAQLSVTAQPETINVKATGNVSTTSGETFPIGVVTAIANGGGNQRIVPANRTIRGAGTDTPTIKVPTGSTGFYLAAGHVQLTQLVIESENTTSNATRASFGLRVFQGADTTTAIDHVTIRNVNNDGILVGRAGASNTAAITMTVGAGTTITGNNRDGIRVSDNGRFVVNSPLGSDPIQISGNTGYGVQIYELGSASITAVPTFPVVTPGEEGTFVVKSNGTGGVYIHNCGTDAMTWTPTNGGPANPVGARTCAITFGGYNLAPPASLLDGVAVWTHTANNGNGIIITAGSNVTVRDSVVLGNARTGLRVDNGPNVTVGGFAYTVFDLTTVDLGTAQSAGKNTFQLGWGTPANLNGGSGLQVNITAGHSQVLKAAGNTLQANVNPTQSIDCSITSGAAARNYPNLTTCYTGNANGGVSICGNIGTIAGANTADLAGCTVP